MHRALTERAEVRIIPAAAAAAAAAAFLVWWATSRRPIYMLDFAVFKAPEHLKLWQTRFEQGSRDCGVRQGTDIRDARNPVRDEYGDARFLATRNDSQPHTLWIWDMATSCLAGSDKKRMLRE